MIFFAIMRESSKRSATSRGPFLVP